ncbi:MAG TPA: hypothetical protein VHM16_09210 [Rubrobacteraceae bacterium]|nr:hypothetical protein [Rubrobacteraceae bacterium]
MVAFEDEYRAYQEALASALRTLRPRAEVSTDYPERAPDSPSHPWPDLVVCNQPDPGGGLAWLELSMEPGVPSNLRIGEHRSRIANPSLQEILSVVDEVERLTDTATGAGNK